LRALMTSLGNRRFGLLFVALLLTIGGGAFLAELGLPRVMNVLIMLDLLVLLTVITDRWVLRIGLGLFAVSLISWGLSTVTAPETLLQAGQISAVILLMLGGDLRLFSDCLQTRSGRSRAPGRGPQLLFTPGVDFCPYLYGDYRVSSGILPFLRRPTPDFAARSLSDMIYFSFVTPGHARVWGHRTAQVLGQRAGHPGGDRRADVPGGGGPPGQPVREVGVQVKILVTSPSAI
jgi:hypothetical protein